MKKTILILFSLLLVSLWVSSAALAGSCTARVVYGSGAIQAVLQPCDFTVPAGKTAINLACYRNNPASNWSSNALCKVYSVTQARDMVDQYGNPNTSLPPGTYRFSVGGSPGAYGTYSYTLTP